MSHKTTVSDGTGIHSRNTAYMILAIGAGNLPCYCQITYRSSFFYIMKEPQRFTALRLLQTVYGVMSSVKAACKAGNALKLSGSSTLIQIQVCLQTDPQVLTVICRLAIPGKLKQIIYILNIQEASLNTLRQLVFRYSFFSCQRTQGKCTEQQKKCQACGKSSDQ